MANRPISLVFGAILLILIGGSGMAAGGGLLGVALNGGATGDVRQSGLTMGALIAAYGFATVLAGVGVLLLRRWAWRLGLLLVVMGLVLLVYALAAVGSLDSMLVSGALLWGLTLVCLVVPGTQRALAA